MKEKLRGHESYRMNCVNLIASENCSSTYVRQVQCSDLMHRYSYWLGNNPRTRYYRGNRYIQEIELKSIELAEKLFGADFVEIRAISGMTANLGVLLGLTSPDDVVMECGRDVGGHRTASKLTTAKVVRLRVINYPVDSSRYNIDLEKTKQIAYEHKPKLLTLGASIFLFPHPVREIKDIAEDIGAYVSYDASHVLGLIAGKQFQQPLNEGADIMLGSTHKTFAGPQGGIILSRNPEAFKRIKLCPNVVDSHHPHRIPGLLLALAEYREFGESYAMQIIRNAKALGAALYDSGFDVLFKDLGFTESHTILVDVSRFGTGRAVAKDLEKIHIILNAMEVPKDVIERRKEPTGLRIGVQEMTRFGMKEREMREIAEFMRDALIEKKNPDRLAKEVIEFRKRFHTLHYCFR